MQILLNLLIDSNGVLREQSQGDKNRNLCHTSRMKNEFKSTDTLIQFATKLTPELRKSFATEKFVQWLEWFLSPGFDLPYDSNELHYDVKQIAGSVDMQAWWWSEWQEFDLKLTDILLQFFTESVSIFAKKHPTSVARLMAAQRTAEDYILFHDQIFSRESDQFASIEQSYCQAIGKAR